MKRKILAFVWVAMLQLMGLRFAAGEEIYMSYPGLTGESAPLWIAKEAGILKEYGIDAKLVYMEGGRLSIQSLLSGTTQFMTGDAVSALSAIAGGADIVLLASAKNVLPYVFAVAKDSSPSGRSEGQNHRNLPDRRPSRGNRPHGHSQYGTRSG